jgi:hypothetical protein
MTIFRVLHNKDYTTVNNFIATDCRISWKAKGLWLYAFSRPDDWSFNLQDLINRSTDGKDGVMTGLKELEEFGYLQRSRFRNEDGSFARGAEWVFFEKPGLTEHCEPKTENPKLEKPNLGNPPLLSTDILLSTEQQQQPAAAAPIYQEVKDSWNFLKNTCGFDDQACDHLCKFSLERIQKQWVNLQITEKMIEIDNRLGWLRKAIENNWQPLEQKEDKEKAQEEKRATQQEKREAIKSRCQLLHQKYEKLFTVKKYFDIGIDVISCKNENYNFFIPFDDNAFYCLESFIKKTFL